VKEQACVSRQQFAGICYNITSFVCQMSETTIALVLVLVQVGLLSFSCSRNENKSGSADL